MKNTFRIIAVVCLVAILGVGSAWAGNDDRRGTAGATELLINPWARSTGWGSVGTANVRGLDAFFCNIAGLSYVQKTEISYSNAMWYGGKSGLVSGATINAFGLGQRVFESGVLGVYVMAMSCGDIPVQTVESPEAGSQGTFSPSLMNINIAYAHSFTTSIHGGVNIKVINETTADITGSGFGIDAGIQYVTGAEDQIKFGINLKNLGAAMNFSGTGLAFTFVNDNDNNMTAEFRSGEMELPTCLNIGLSYDFLMEKFDQRLTIAGNFTSNAFLKDNFTIGAEYSLLDMIQFRAGYVYQTGLLDDDARTTANSGLCAGASFDIPLSKKEGSNSAMSIDYSYRTADLMKGTHTIGATIKL